MTYDFLLQVVWIFESICAQQGRLERGAYILSECTGNTEKESQVSIVKGII